jgi:hypothetical protein
VGGNSSNESSDLQSDVITIVSTSVAFAALKINGKVITWPDWSVKSPNVWEFLQNEVIQIEVVGDDKFRATKIDGTQIQWKPSL